MENMKINKPRGGGGGKHLLFNEIIDIFRKVVIRNRWGER